MTDRKQERLDKKLAARQFDDPEVRGVCDDAGPDGMQAMFGPPVVTTVYHEGTGRYWRQGDGRPTLADDDPAVIQAMGRCVIGRSQIAAGYGLRSDAATHPRTCEWCEYPPRELLAACEWAAWMSRYVVSEAAVWWQDGQGHRGPSYGREVRAMGYDNPAWRRFWALSVSERVALVTAAQYPEEAAR